MIREEEQEATAAAPPTRTKIHYVALMFVKLLLKRKMFVSVCGQSDREAALRLVLEAQIREEVSAEFMELFSKMEKDYR